MLRECEEHRPFIQRSKDPFPVELLTMLKNCALALQGKTAAPYSLSDGAYDETASELHYRRIGNLTLVFFQNIVRLQLACLFGRYEDALALSEKGEAVVRSASGITQVADHYLYRGLAAAVALTGPDARRRTAPQNAAALPCALACLCQPTARTISGSTKPCSRPKRLA